MTLATNYIKQINKETASKKSNSIAPLHIALIDWSHLIEDYLDNIGSTIQDFCEKTTGGWMFGYIEALKCKDVKTTLICFSARFKTTTYFVHQPSGATLCIVPASGLYRWIRKKIPNPYATTLYEAIGYVPALKKPFYNLLLQFSPYLATPIHQLYNLLKKLNIHAVLCQEYENPRFDLCVLVAQWLRIPVFASFQGGNWQLSPLERYVRSIAIKHCSGLIVGTGVEIQRLKKRYKIAENKIEKIFNPVDLHMWPDLRKEEARLTLGIAPEAKVVVWHGRIDYHRKGLDILLAVWEKITRNTPHESLKLLLVGNGNDATLLRKHLNSLKLNSIEWVDEYINDRKKLLCYLKAADIYAFPSRNEGFPVAPIEAMACGLPLVATDAPGVSEIIGQGKSGGIIVPKDDVGAFEKGLKCLLNNPRLCKRLGLIARQRVESLYSLESVGDQLSRFIFKES